MSYEISYRRQAFVLPAKQTGHHDDLFFLVEEAGSNNCYELNCRRRSRSWACLAAGAQWECLGEVTRMAAACCGGSLCLYGHRSTTPETYIRAWRKALAAATPLADAARTGFYLQLFTRMPLEKGPDDRSYARERLAAQTLVAPQAGEDPFTHVKHLEWHFSAAVPEQAQLWLETKTGGRGWHSVAVMGPHR